MNKKPDENITGNTANPERPTFSIVTLGCKVNRYESDKIREDLARKGFRELDPKSGETPDLCIVNTCTVTGEAARKSRQAARRPLKKNKKTIVYAIGCAAEIPEDALSNLPDEIIIAGNDAKEDLAQVIAERFEQNKDYTPLPPPEGRMRAHLKIQDGCDNFCSYCVIPHVRGRSRSREPEDILAELLEIEKKGFSEVVITGIHIGDYGKKINNRMNLPQLLDYLLENSKIPRIRLSSLEPMDFTLELPELYKRHQRLCPHLHLSLQHASNRILEKMNRNYTIEEYDGFVRKSLELIPRMAFTTDVIVGFPGETDEDVEFLADYLEKTPFLRVHLFPFSPHKRTRAASMEGIVPGNIKKERLNRLMTIARKKTIDFLDSQIGKKIEVLPEKIDDSGLLTGHSDNYIEVSFKGNDNLTGQIIELKITRRMGEKLYGENPELILPRR